MTRTIPYPAYVDQMPVDISFVFEGEKPAGKHGFLKIDGEQFRFEDGTLAKFWGVNFNGGACFPEHEYSKKVARRLAQVGCNIVRFHQLDAEWNTPNIFSYAKGKRVESTRSLDPVSMDRLDYLIWCLKEQGIYCYLDMLTYRKFKSGDGVENTVELYDSARPYCIYNRRLIDLQKEFAEQLWTHRNPYTGLAYKDDPAFVLCEILNETDLYSGVLCALKAEPYVTEFRTRFDAWLKGRDDEIDAMTCDVNEKHPAIIAFKMELSKAYYKELYDHIRSLGVKIPLTGTNWTRESAILHDNLQDMDFTDSHYYVYDWRWGEQDKFCFSQRLSGMERTGFAKLAKMRTFDKPFFVSEWDMPWPNPYRAEGPLMYAAINCLQNWNGMAIHTYAYGTRLEEMKILGKEVSSASIGGTPYREGIFSTWNDPAKFGLFYHCALMVRRGDISPAQKKVACNIEALDTTDWTALHHSVEVHQVGSCFDNKSPNADEIHPESEAFIQPNGELRSDTGEMYRNWKKGYGTADSPRTKFAYGKLNAQGRIELDGFSVTCQNDFAVVALSSLCDRSIEESDNLLLTTVGRARNTDYASEGDKTLDFGKPPILAEVIGAEISIRTKHKNMRVHAINAEGFEVGAPAAVWKDGVLTFTVGDKFPSVYYLIQAE